MTTIRTPRMLLRHVVEADVEPLATILQEPEVAAYWPRFDAERIAEEMILDEPDEDEDEDEENYEVFTMEYEGEPIGVIQYWEEPEDDYRHAGMDIFVTTKLHRQGFGTEALVAMIDHLFDVRGHHRLVIDPCAENTRAMRTYENLGFQRVGIMRGYERGPDGTWRSSVLYDLLADEWLAAKAGTHA